MGRNAAIGGLLGLATTPYGSGKERKLASAGGSAACHQAKGELLEAETEKEIHAYSRKACILCDH